MARLLDWPCATAALKLEAKDGGWLRVERELENNRLGVVDLRLPAVVTVQTGINEPRYASLKGIMAAKKKTIQALDAAGVSLDAAALTPKVRVAALALPPARPPITMIVAPDPASQAKELLRLLHEEAKVI